MRFVVATAKRTSSAVQSRIHVHSSWATWPTADVTASPPHFGARISSSRRSSMPTSGSKQRFTATIRSPQSGVVRSRST